MRPLTAAILLAISSTAAAADGDGAALFDEWFEIAIEGNKIGSVHQSLVATPFEGTGALRATSEIRTTFLRDGIPIESVSTTESLSRQESLDPIGYQSLSQDGGQTRTAAGHPVEGNRFLFETKIGGKVSEKEAPVAGGAIYSSLVEHLVRKNLKDGWRWSGPVIMEADVDVAQAVVSVSSDVKRPACPCGGGVCAPARFVSRTAVAGLESIEWRDAKGRPLCVSVPAMKGVFTLVTREKALSGFDPFDIFARSLMKPDRPLGKPADLQSVTLRLTFDGPAPSIPEDDRQKIAARDGRELTLSIARVPAKPGVKRPVDAPEMKRFLAPTTYEQSDAPEIRARAKELAWATDDALEAAAEITRWAHTRLKAGMGQGYLSAVEALKAGEGDCTEFSVLASAVAKAAGLPARLVTGVVYVDGKFGFHAWLEVWVGYWHPLDPTLDETDINPTHIKLWTGIGEPGELRDAAVAVLNLFKGVTIKVVETSYRTQ